MADVIVGRSITKTYRVRVGRARIREMLPPPFDAATRSLFPRWWLKDTFNALEDVSIVIPQGSSFGIIGHNGAGKTTLLKVLAMVTSPTHGTVMVSSRVAALIDALVGFHPDLTGRENVYLLGSMFGFGRRTMASRLDDILEFAEIDKSADTPVKRFSAGMAARLGFATLTALDVGILLIDEVLAVGDATFQRKCVEWLEGFQNQGGTLLFVSHNLGLVRSMTEQVLWLDHGHVIAQGPTDSVLSEYAMAMEHRDSDRPSSRLGDVRKAIAPRGMQRWGAGGARVQEVHVDQPSTNGSELRVSITYEATDVDRGLFCIGFIDEGGNDIGSATSPMVRLRDGGGSIQCLIRPLPLRSGIYFPVVAIVASDGRIRDRWRLDRAVVIDKDGERPLSESFGPVELGGTWSGNVIHRPE
jgi:ABC-type polysaccharide/polyol phosphate transport system ATPase subunit